MLTAIVIGFAMTAFTVVLALRSFSITGNDHVNGEETRGVEDHLGECESCREGYHALQRVLNSVDSLPVPERGADYEARVWQGIEKALPRKRSFSSRWFSWKPLLGAGAMTALLVAAFLAGRTVQKTPAVADSQVRERLGLRPGGFGIFVTRQMVDELIYNEAGNEVLLIKYMP